MTSRDDDKRAGEVLSSLPSTRPQRRSSKRDGAKASGKARTSAPAKARKAGAAKRAGAAAKPAAKAAGTAKPTATSKPRSVGVRRPAAVRPSAATRRAQTGGAKAPRPSDDRPSGAPEGVELVGTALQAAGELAQIGLSVGSQALRGVLSRLPRP